MQGFIKGGLLLACTLLPALAHTTTQAQTLALDDVRIVDAEHGTTGPRCVRIERSHIVRVDDAGSGSCRRDARVLDLRDRYLMPGLIDMHAHLTLGPLEIRRDWERVTGWGASPRDSKPI